METATYRHCRRLDEKNNRCKKKGGEQSRDNVEIAFTEHLFG
jgi:hypothetical protein